MRAVVLLSLVSAAVATTLLIPSVAAAQTAPPGMAQTPDVDDDDQEPDTDEDGMSPNKRWNVGTSFTTNRSIYREDVGGANRASNSLGVSAGFAITPKDTIRANWGVIQRFIADAEETGFRVDDPNLNYSHRFLLPARIMLGTSLGNSFPVSYHSRLRSSIATPRAGLSLGRSFLDNTLSFSTNGNANYHIVKYNAGIQGGQNTQFSTSVGFSVSYTMPFHRALQISGNVSTSWSWDYEVDHLNDPNLAQQFEGQNIQPSADPYFARPAGQQGYGGGVQVSYSLPSLKGINSSIQLGVSQGDGVMRDGATTLYWLSRRGSQMNASLSLSY